MAVTWEYPSPSLQSMSCIHMYVNYDLNIGTLNLAELTWPCTCSAHWQLAHLFGQWSMLHEHCQVLFGLDSTLPSTPHTLYSHYQTMKTIQFSHSHFKSSCRLLALSRRAAALAYKSKVWKWSRQRYVCIWFSASKPCLSAICSSFWVWKYHLWWRDPQFPLSIGICLSFAFLESLSVSSCLWSIVLVHTLLPTKWRNFTPTHWTCPGTNQLKHSSQNYLLVNSRSPSISTVLLSWFHEI